MPNRRDVCIVKADHSRSGDEVGDDKGEEGAFRVTMTNSGICVYWTFVQAGCSSPDEDEPIERHDQPDRDRLAQQANNQWQGESCAASITRGFHVRDGHKCRKRYEELCEERKGRFIHRHLGESHEGADMNIEGGNSGVRKKICRGGERR